MSQNRKLGGLTRNLGDESAHSCRDQVPSDVQGGRQVLG